MNLQTGASGPLLRLQTPATGAVVFSEDGKRLYVANGPGTVLVFPTNSDKPERSFTVLEKGLSTMRLLPGGRQMLCAATNQPEFVLWDLTKNDAVRRFAGVPPHGTLGLAAFSDGKSRGQCSQQRLGICLVDRNRRRGG